MDPRLVKPQTLYFILISLLIERFPRVPFYGYLRLLFLLYLILPQFQGARVLYEQYVHPFLQENEGHIDEFIASAHDRLKTAGISYFRRAIEYVRENLLQLPPREPDTPTPPPASASPQTYTQALLARFSVPTKAVAAGSSDFYSLLANAVSAATSVGRSSPDMTASGTLIPANLKDSGEKMSFIAAQRDRLNIVLQMLDREAQELQRTDTRSASINMDGSAEDVTQRPASGLSKSRSEADFEKIEAESGTEEEATLRRRNVSSGGSWLPFGFGGQATPSSTQDE